MLKTIRELCRWRDLIRNMVLRNLRVRYKGSVLGFLWTMISPLFMMLIYFLFLRLLRIPIDLPELLIGILAWTFFATCLSDAVVVITAAPSLVKRTPFPKLVMPAAMILANLINFLLSLLVLAGFLAVSIIFFGYRSAAGWSLLALPGVIILNLALVAGLSSFLACLNVYFRDTEHLISILLLAWFFMTPIMYPLERALGSLSPALFSLYCLNPMVAVVSLYRFVFLGTAPPAAAGFYISMAVCLLTMVLGTAFFLRREPYFADEL
ncbi:MAG TPA: ABC transporter permease [bacterium]|nr:ABC transporter permease [bacterium]